MNIHHHLNDVTLMAFAAGSTAENHRFVIATHLSLCAQCRRKVSEMEHIGGLAIERLPESTMASNALENVMLMLEANTAKDEPIQAVPQGPANVPKPLRHYLPEGLDGIAWKSMAPGIKSYNLPGMNYRTGSLRLIKIAPGVSIPEHTHSGTELTLVLSGSYSDEVGRFQSGDIADLDDHYNHQPIADTDEDCICLIATEAPLKFKAMVPRLMGYFVGL